MNRAVLSLSAVRVISFDLDDTFWDCAPAITNAEDALFRWHQVNTPRITQVHDERSLFDYRTGIRSQYPELTGCVTQIRLQGLRDLLAQFDYSPTQADEAFEVFYRARSEVDIYPQVIELLDLLKGRFGVAAITNGNADLAQIGIAHHFERVFAANLELQAKPHHDMFSRCLAHFGISGEQMLHIGDNPITDVVGAMNAGAQALWFNQHGHEWNAEHPEAHYEAQSISQIIALLRPHL